MAFIRRPGGKGRPERTGAEGSRPGEGTVTEAADRNAAVPAGTQTQDRGGTAEAEPPRNRDRGRHPAALAAALGRGAALGARALADRLLEAAPRIPVRDLATLRAQYRDPADAEELADRLVAGALRASGSVGAGVGAAAVLPVPPAMVVEVAAETLAVAALEIKLVAELHEAYGLPAPGTAAQRAYAYLTAWADRRGVDHHRALTRPAGVAALAVSSEVRRRLRGRLTRTSLRRLPTLTPLMLGAGIGATVNRRDTRRLAEDVRADLRGRHPADPAYWTRPRPPAGPLDGRR